MEKKGKAASLCYIHTRSALLFVCTTEESVQRKNLQSAKNISNRSTGCGASIIPGSTNLAGY